MHDSSFMEVVKNDKNLPENAHALFLSKRELVEVPKAERRNENRGGRFNVVDDLKDIFLSLVNGCLLVIVFIPTWGESCMILISSLIF